jgi:imidazole glycerol-phosphate synthase subunit HisF
MLKNRLIPSIILNNGNIVQSVNFDHKNIVGNAITAVDFFNSWAVDEIIILDVSRDENNRQKFHKIITGLSKRCFVPLTVGGWIKNIDDIRQILSEGADKVCINTEAFRNTHFISEASRVFGSQCIVISIDVRKTQSGKYRVFVDRGRENTNLDAIEWAREVEKKGAGEIFLTSIDNDGKKGGYDLELVKKITSSVNIPVITFGGVGNWDHLVDGISIGNADAVSAANIFHHTEHSTHNAKEFMKNAGLNVRQSNFYKLPTPRKPKYNEIF